jgi:hypothetical protein
MFTMSLTSLHGSREQPLGRSVGADKGRELGLFDPEIGPCHRELKTHQMERSVKAQID